MRTIAVIRLVCGLGLELGLGLAAVACDENGSLNVDLSPSARSDRGGGPADDTAAVFKPTTTSDGGVPSNDPACTTATVTAEALPVSLVIMFDRSGSMDTPTKWQPCKAGLQAFFADPSSKGVSASLGYFAQPDNTCSPSSYATPFVSMRPLPDAISFKSMIDGVPIYSDGATPTLPALRGAISHAQTLLQAAAAKEGSGSRERVAVVLVTDGVPSGCSSSVENVATEAAKVAKSIPTYVVGVGNALDNLNAIANAGGTGQAIMIPTNDPAQVSKDFAAAIAKVRGSALACEYAIPAPPQGQVLDLKKVNVVYTPAGGNAEVLSYDKDCATGQGWRYDDPNAPKRIELCPTRCDAMKKSAASSSRMNIALGCATQGDGPK